MDRVQTADAAAELNALAEAKGWPMRSDGTLTFEHGELSELCNLWRSKAAGGVPARSQFDMRMLAPYARNIMILEQAGEAQEGRYRFRLFGSTLMFLFGEHTGRFLHEMVSEELLPSWQAFYGAVLASRAPLRLITYYRTPNEAYLKGEIFAAPLADETGAVRLILAATYVGLQDSVPPPLV